MKFNDYVPGWIKEWMNHIRTVRRIPASSMVSKNSKLYPGVKIGEHSYINGNSCVFCGEIGKYCSIGYNVQIGPPEHPIDRVSTHPRFYNNAWSEVTAPVSISHDVWIGSNAVILQGVKVGIGAVIAAGAVVTKDIPPYTVWGGVTARCIKARFSDDVIEKLLKSSWWEWNETELKAAHMESLEDFLEYMEQRNVKLEQDQFPSVNEGLRKRTGVK